MIYLTLYFGLIASLVFNKKTVGEELRFINTLALMVVFTSLVGFRDGVGHDFDSYQEINNSAGSIFDGKTILSIIDSWSQLHSEFGFIFINYLFNSLNLTLNIFLLAFSGFSFLFILLATRRYQSEVSWTFFLYISIYLTIYHFSQIRIGFTSSVFLYLSWYIYTKSFWKYMAGVIIISMIHKLALILIPIYFVRFNLSVRNSLIALSLSVIIWFIDVFDFIGPVLQNSGVWALYQVYYYSTMDLYKVNSLPFATLSAHIWFYFSSLYLAKKIFHLGHPVYVLLRCYLIGICLLIALLETSILAGRIFGMLSIGLVIFSPLIYFRTKKKAFRAIYIMPILLYSFLIFIKSIFFEENFMLPYNSIL